MTSRSVTLSSAGTSGVINLDWIGGKPVVARAIQASSAVAINFTLQATLDDVQNVAAASVSWFNVSAPWGSSTVTAVTSAFFDTGGMTWAMNPPPAALRISSTTNASSVGITLKVLQGDGG